ncbi:MAG: PAS domain-containing sensor histidine kinase, partial [Anaerolineae bacterium]|nr:PAS domain-containing sensor histidine kinase [Anaerolineae bacterium]
MNPQLKKIPYRTALTYALLAGAYILLSDRFVALFAFNTTLMTRLQTYKGWAFVLVTAGLLYLLLRNQLHALSQEIEER